MADLVGKSINVPVWINNDQLFVESVDVPLGQWTVLLRLTPIDEDALELENGYLIRDVQFDVDPLPKGFQVLNTSRQVYGGQGWLLFFDNQIEPEPIKQPKKSRGKHHRPELEVVREVRPVPIRYHIDIVKSFGDSTRSDVHRIDPVVIAQPDPIYP